MSRAAKNQAKKTFNETQGVYNDQNAMAKSAYNQIFPALTKEATNPTGFDPADLAAMNTASQQSLGGATAGAVGEGDLMGARTRNAGSFAPALDEAVRSGERQLSQNAVDTQSKNAILKESKRQSGLSGLSDLFKTNTNSMLSALGLGNNATNALTNAGQSGWFQNFLGLTNALKPGYSNGQVSFG